jgi:predicted amidohydrolase YtcJ
VTSLLLRQVEVGGRVVDVMVDHDVVTRVGPPGSVGGAHHVHDGGGGALIPGLHDHHIHLMALAAAWASVDVSGGLDDAIRAAHAASPVGSWIRAVGYHEPEAGLDRWRLDALAPGRPVRVQHQSGAMWVLSSAALERVRPDAADQPGIERDAQGRPTGRLYRLDEWLGHRIPAGPSPDLAPVGRRLASFGLTGVTDCTPTTSTAYLQTLADAATGGDLPLTVTVTGGPGLAEHTPPAPLLSGPVKIVIEDHELPGLDFLVDAIGRAHRAGRPVAVHCVTRAALLLALAAWDDTGSMRGDRIEHASVTPPEAMAPLRDLGLTVVTQPAFVVARGDSYLQDVDPADRPDLYRCASLQAAGIPVGGSTDAPFGPPDPWVAMQAAVDRRTATAARVNEAEGITAAAALDLFLAPLDQPGGAVRTVRPGVPADLCLLGLPLRKALGSLSSDHVAMTLSGGRVSYRR